MYVVVRKRKLTRRKQPTGHLGLSFYLMRSARPQPQLIAYLGSITSDRIGCRWAHENLWARTAQILDRLGLKPEERTHIEDALHARTARPESLTIDPKLPPARKIRFRKPILRSPV